MWKSSRHVSLMAGSCLLVLTGTADAETITVNWYHGKEFLYPVAQAFTAETGIKVKVTNSDDTFDTDVMFVPDYATLRKSETLHHFMKIQSDERDARVPSQWRDDEGLWYGALVRLRGVVYHPDKVDQARINTAFDLMDPAYKGRVCLLQGSYKANRTFLAGLIAEAGEAKALEWATAVKDNMGPPFDNDMDNIARVAKGVCDVAYADNYYYHYMLEGKATSKYNIPAGYMALLPGYAEKVKFKWLDQDTVGNVTNITAIAVNKTTQHKDAALRFVDFALSDKGQYLMAENLFKYPVVPGVAWPQRLKDAGRVRIRDRDIKSLDPFYEVADRVFKQAGWP